MKLHLVRFILVLTLFVIFPISIFGEWTKEDWHSFRKAPEYRVVFDLSMTNYDGMDSISFVEYNAAKNDMTPERFSTILKYIGPEICKYLSKHSKKKFSLNSDSKYIVHIRLDEITNRAGMIVTVSNYFESPENDFTFTSKVSNGRWNQFDQLLEESCEKLAKNILSSKEIVLDKSVKKNQRYQYDYIYK